MTRSPWRQLEKAAVQRPAARLRGLRRTLLPIQQFFSCQTNTTCNYRTLTCLSRLATGDCQLIGHGTIQISAKVAKLADAPDLGSGGAIHRGSSPLFRTRILTQQQQKAIP